MGMSIDKTIDFFNGLECHTPQAKDAREVAISTMRKYQKIEEMLYEFKDMTFAPCLMKGHMCAVHEILNEVIEDGNDTTNTGSN